MWHALRVKRNGHPQVYSNEAILLLLILKTVYRLTYRSLQGFVTSLFSRENLPLAVPSYSQICRRAKSLSSPRLSSRRPRAIVIDSTGLKIYGEGEWLAKKHGISKRHTWKKLHVAMCATSQELVAVEVTDATVTDGEVLPRLLQACPGSMREVIADGAYDTKSCYQAIHQAGAIGIIPPRKTASYDLVTSDSWSHRNQSVLEIQVLGNDSVARKIWKKSRGYHRRSLVETAMYRYKQLTGDKLSSRQASAWLSEVFIKSLIINKMNRLGMPIGVYD